MMRALLLLAVFLFGLPHAAGAAPPVRWRIQYDLSVSISKQGPGGTPVVPHARWVDNECGMAGEFQYRLHCEIEFHLQPGSHPASPVAVLDRMRWNAEVGGLSSWVGPNNEETQQGAGGGGRAGGTFSGEEIKAEDLGLRLHLGEKDAATGETPLDVSIGPVSRTLQERMVLRYEVLPVDVAIRRPQGARPYTESYFQPARTYVAQLNLPGTFAKGKIRGGQPFLEGEEAITGGHIRLQLGGAVARDELTVVGDVVHRLAVPAQTDAPAFAHLSGGKGALPVAGQPTVEAWLVPPKPNGAPLASARVRDGKFQLQVPLERRRTLLLKTTWHNQAARLEEHGLVEVSCDEILKARGAASGSAWSASLPTRRHGKGYARFAGQIREFDLGQESRDATLRRGGQGLALEFRGNQALLVNTMVLKAPYLNQNSHTTTVKATVPKGRLRQNLPPWFSEAEKQEVLGRLPEGDTMDLRVQGAVVCFPSCASMILGCLGAETVSGPVSPVVQATMQGVYDLYLQTEGPKDPVWGWPFEFPLPEVSKAIESLVGGGVPLEQATRTVQAQFGAGSFAKWPYQAKDETYRGNNVLWMATIPATLRPWQIVDPTHRYLQPRYGIGTEFRNVDVFSRAQAPAVLNALGRGRPGLVSIRHREADGGEGGHILVLLGAMLDNAGNPVRLIFHDPYGDQTRTPAVEGYYGSASDVDRSGADWGAYAPYGPDVNSYGGTMPGKYWCVYTPAGEKDVPPGQWQAVLPAKIARRLLPSD